MQKVHINKDNIAKMVNRDIALLGREVDKTSLEEATKSIVNIPLNMRVLNTILNSMPDEQMTSNRETVIARLYSSNIIAGARILENGGTLDTFITSIKDRFALGGALNG